MDCIVLGVAESDTTERLSLSLEAFMGLIESIEFLSALVSDGA